VVQADHGSNAHWWTIAVDYDDNVHAWFRIGDALRNASRLWIESNSVLELASLSVSP